MGQTQKDQRICTICISLACKITAVGLTINSLALLQMLNNLLWQWKEMTLLLKLYNGCKESNNAHKTIKVALQ